SARIAREANKYDAFNALLTTLIARAPNDEQVKQLASSRTAAPPPPAVITAPPSTDARKSIDIELSEEDGDVVLEDADVEVEAPFALERQARDSVVSLDPAAEIKQLIGQAETFRRAHDYTTAVILLEGGIEAHPS